MLLPEHSHFSTKRSHCVSSACGIARRDRKRWCWWIDSWTWATKFWNSPNPPPTAARYQVICLSLQSPTWHARWERFLDMFDLSHLLVGERAHSKSVGKRRKNFVWAKGFTMIADVTAPWRFALNETLPKATWGCQNVYLLSRKTLKCIVVSISVTVYKSCCFFGIAFQHSVQHKVIAQGGLRKKKQNTNPWVPMTSWCMRSFSSLSCPPGWKRCQWRHHGGATLLAALLWKPDIHSNSTKTLDRIPMPSFSSILFLSFPRKTQCLSPATFTLTTAANWSIKPLFLFNASSSPVQITSISTATPPPPLPLIGTSITLTWVRFFYL